MNLLTIAEFAAARRKVQDDAIDLLLDLARDFAKGIEGAEEALLAALIELYETTYKAEGGEKTPIFDPAKVFEKVFEKTTAESDAVNIATVLAVATTNAATVQAAGDDEEPLLMEWVTMHDKDVRAEHEAVSGQQRPVGETFAVGGHDMPYPGYTGVPIELWINCRCTLAPALMNAVTAAAEEDKMEDETPTMQAIPWYGVLAPEGEWSGDGRQFADNSLTHRDLPLPLTWQKASSDGHSGSVVVAKMDRAARVEKEYRATGFFLASVEADEVIGMIAEFGKFGVSVDADDAEFEFDEDTGKVTFTKARIASASIVAIPAFAQAYVALGTPPEGFLPEEVEDESLAASYMTEEYGRGPGWITNPADTKRLHDYWTKPGEEGYAKIGWGTGGDFNRCRVLVGEKIAENSPEDTVYLNQICAQWHHDALGIWPGEHLSAKDVMEGVGQGEAISLVASIKGHTAPDDWFTDPEFTKPTPMRVDAEGRVSGHLAQWGVCHLGFGKVCVTANETDTVDFSLFLNGEVLLESGEYLPVGHIVLGGEHAPDSMSASQANMFYASTSTCVADVNVGRDDHGIWVAGWVRPGTSDADITALRASPLSGDWRRNKGQLQLLLGLAVNVPGFPVKRVAASVKDGVQWSLTAAGIVTEEEAKPSMEIEAVAEAVAAAIEARAARRARMAELAEKVGANNGM